MTTSEREPRAGQRLGRYELLIPVANGGMAEVWAARLAGTRGFKKIVAIKTILPMTVDEPRFERMFIAEAKLAAQIHHPNVVETIEFAEHLGKLYLVMEWVEGETLGSIITQTNQHGGLPMSVAVNIVGQICKGLHAAHELCDEEGNPLGLVHRDISPQNLIVSYSGTAKLLDFGVAKATLRISNLTEAGELKGKLAYMSPEQLNGREIDRRSDIFSVGVLLYMLTTGRHPFKGQNTDDTLRNICSARPVPPPGTIIPNFPPRLAVILKKALRKRPEERFSTALELVAALEQAHPDCFDSSFETRLSSFMRELFAARIAERRAELRLAEARCERRSDESSRSRLSALAAPPAVAAGPAQVEEVPAPSIVELEAGDPPGASLHAFSPPRSRAVWLFAAAAALGIVALTLIGSHAVRRAKAREAPIVETVILAAAAPKPLQGSGAPPTLVPKAALAPAAAAPAASGSPPSPARRTIVRRASAQSVNRGLAKPLPRRKQEAPAAVVSAPVVVEPPPVKMVRPVNAWDPSTYGGRF